MSHVMSSRIVCDPNDFVRPRIEISTSKPGAPPWPFREASADDSPERGSTAVSVDGTLSPSSSPSWWLANAGSGLVSPVPARQKPVLVDTE
jgi:hypothetical protein